MNYQLGADYYNRRDWQNKTPVKLKKVVGFLFVFERRNGEEYIMTDCVFEDMRLCNPQLKLFK